MGQALGWSDLVDGSHGHRLNRHSGLGGRPSGPHAAARQRLSHLLRTAARRLAALGATLYVAIAATAVLVIIVPVSAGPGRQEPRRGLAQAVYTLFVAEVTTFITTGVAKMGPRHCAWDQLTAVRAAARRGASDSGSVFRSDMAPTPQAEDEYVLLLP